MGQNKVIKSSLKVATAAMIINICEWYDYALFGLQAEIIGKNFFNPAGYNTLLQAFGVFALGYLCRPLGGILLGYISDRTNKFFALQISILLMSLPTFCIGVLPGYQNIGIISSILLCLARAMQGIAIGGAVTTSVYLVMQEAPKQAKSLAVALTMSGLCTGVFLGSVAVQVTRYALGVASFEAFGWRMPFLLAFPVMFVAFWVKNKALRNLDSHETAVQSQQSLIQTIVSCREKIIFSIVLNAPGSILFYFQSVYLPAYLSVVRNVAFWDIAFITTFGHILMIILTVVAGVFADIFGKVKVMRGALWVGVILIAPIFYFIAFGDLWQISIAQVSLSLLTASCIAIEPAIQCELYRGKNSILGLSYNLATIIFGGGTPCLLHLVDSTFFTATYILCASLAALFALRSISLLIIESQKQPE